MRQDKFKREIYDQKVSSDIFAEQIEKRSDWIGCVPDTIFKKVLPNLQTWQIAPRENHLIGMAFGASLAGKNPTVLIQNSGLGLCLDALLGTFCLYKKGLLMIISNRGILSWEEPQHKDWGKCTESILSAAKIEIVRFDEEGEEGIERASISAFEKNKVVALVVQRGNLDE